MAVPIVVVVVVSSSSSSLVQLGRKNHHYHWTGRAVVSSSSTTPFTMSNRTLETIRTKKNHLHQVGTYIHTLGTYIHKFVILSIRLSDTYKKTGRNGKRKAESGKQKRRTDLALGAAIPPNSACIPTYVTYGTLGIYIKNGRVR